jgi:hypothetical protein
MPEFRYEDCLYKHYVREKGWLPLCRERQRIVRSDGQKHMRRIRYFTFCAVGAVDVLMLDVTRIVTRSSSGKFDNVTFFERTPEAVLATQAAIPGAIGFAGDFLTITLLKDDAEEDVVDDPDPLIAPETATDSAATRTRQRLIESRRQFIKCFPFDVMNFDLEEFFFKPNDPIPGRMVSTLQKVFEWQKRPGTDAGGRPIEISSFSLMFTTRVGPPNLSAAYLDAIQAALETNVGANTNVRDAFAGQVGHVDPGRLRTEDFDAFFKLGLPKIMAALLKDHGWIVDDDRGIRVYAFTRGEGEAKYEMLHLIMHAQRQPPRVPGAVDPVVETAYSRVVERLFREGTEEVTPAVVEGHRGDLEASLAQIFARRRKYRGA